jgi:hypothetical protein
MMEALGSLSQDILIITIYSLSASAESSSTGSACNTQMMASCCPQGFTRLPAPFFYNGFQILWNTISLSTANESGIHQIPITGHSLISASIAAVIVLLPNNAPL